jgi:hypothetical protein
MNKKKENFTHFRYVAHKTRPFKIIEIPVSTLNRLVPLTVRLRTTRPQLSSPEQYDSLMNQND